MSDQITKVEQHSIIEKVLKRLKMEDEEIEMVLLFTNILLTNYAQNLLKNAFTNEEVKAFKAESDLRDFDEFREYLMFAEAYRVKIGKSLEIELEDFLNDFAMIIERSYETVQDSISTLARMNQQELEAKSEE